MEVQIGGNTVKKILIFLILLTTLLVSYSWLNQTTNLPEREVHYVDEKVSTLTVGPAEIDRGGYHRFWYYHPQPRNNSHVFFGLPQFT